MTYSFYKGKVEEGLQKLIPTLGEKNVLRDACAYALLNGGKRIRPAISIMIADAIGKNLDASQSGLAVELFHTASLVVDDLPCMDNDDIRRDNPTVHKKYGETLALLVSYTLISAGYGLIAKNAQQMKYGEQICTITLENASFNTGLLGATGGQFLDVFPPNLDIETIKKVIHRKTISLFEISFVNGWLYGGGDLKKLDLVKKASHHFGMGFQIADDLGDMEQDVTNNRKINIATILGREKALEMLQDEQAQFKDTLKDLQIHQHTLESLFGEVAAESLVPK